MNNSSEVWRSVPSLETWGQKEFSNLWHLTRYMSHFTVVHFSHYPVIKAAFKLPLPLKSALSIFLKCLTIPVWSFSDDTLWYSKLVGHVEHQWFSKVISDISMWKCWFRRAFNWKMTNFLVMNYENTASQADILLQGNSYYHKTILPFNLLRGNSYYRNTVTITVDYNSYYCNDFWNMVYYKISFFQVKLDFLELS